MKFVLSTGFLLSVFMLAGCGGPSTGSVKGKVVYNNAPVTGYTLNLVWTEKGIATTVPLDDSGSFTVKEPLEAGPYRAYLAPTPPEPAAPGTPMKKVTVSKVPAKTTDPIKSDLVVTITKGENAVTLELKD